VKSEVPVCTPFEEAGIVILSLARRGGKHTRTHTHTHTSSSGIIKLSQ